MTASRLHNRAGRIPATSLEKHEAALLVVARDAFYAHGFEGTSIEAIARIAHVSPKTIYGRYINNQGLFVASVRPRVEEVLKSIGTPPQSDSDLRTALVDFAIRLLTATTTPEALLMQRLIIAESARFPELGSAFYEAGPKRSIAALTVFFLRATETGLMQIADPASIAEMLLGALLGVPIRSALIRHARPSRRAIAARANEVVSLFIAAYGRERGLPAKSSGR